jgi:hypothetical protein
LGKLFVKRTCKNIEGERQGEEKEKIKKHKMDNIYFTPIQNVSLCVLSSLLSTLSVKAAAIALQNAI